jgi:predicted Zn finger-like uncharacterized protein
MPFPIVCPECDARLQVPDTLAGKRVKCKKCGGTFVARPVDDDDDDRPARPAAKAADKPRPRPVADDEDEGDRPQRRSARASRRDDDDDADQNRPRRRSRDEDDEDDEPRPRGKKKGKKKAGSPVLLFVLLGVGALVLIGGGIGVYFAFIKEDKPADQPVAKGDAPKGSAGKGGAAGADAGTAGWVEVHEPEGRYRVKFPVAATAMNQQAKLPEGVVNVKLHLAQVPANQEAFVSLHEMIPPGAPNEALFAKEIDTVKTQAPGATVSDLKSITYQGHEGRQFLLSMPGKKEAMVVRMIAADNRVIALMAAAPNASADTPRIKAFFESLKIE